MVCHAAYTDSVGIATLSALTKSQGLPAVLNLTTPHQQSTPCAVHLNPQPLMLTVRSQVTLIQLLLACLYYLVCLWCPESTFISLLGLCPPLLPDLCCHHSQPLGSPASPHSPFSNLPKLTCDVSIQVLNPYITLKCNSFGKIL